MKKALFLAIGLLITVVCFYFVFRDIDLQVLWQEVGSVRWGWALLCAAIFYGGFYLRATRWAMFYPAEANVTGRGIFGPMMAGYALNSILPARPGEPGRALLVARRERVSFPTSLATVVAERVVDILVILALLVVVMASVRFGDFSLSNEKWTLNAEVLGGLAKSLSAFGLVLGIGILTLMSRRARVFFERLAEALPMPEKLRSFGIHMMHTFANGFDAFRSPRQALWVLFYSALIWGSSAWCIQALALAFGLSMSMGQAFAVMVIICIAIALPATPGYWGLFEFGFRFSAMALGIRTAAGELASAETVLAMALLLHLIQYVPIVAYGLIWSSIQGASLLEAAHSAEAVESRPGESARNGEYVENPARKKSE